jgi:hypothetical protein
MTAQLRATLLCLAVTLPLTACVAYPVATQTTVPASFDRSWNAALGAAQDVGISVGSTDRASGRIYGRRGNADVLIALNPQPDGSLRVAFDAKNLGPQDQGLNNAFAQAYNRRMGR